MRVHYVEIRAIDFTDSKESMQVILQCVHQSYTAFKIAMRELELEQEKKSLEDIESISSIRKKALTARLFYSLMRVKSSERWEMLKKWEEILPCVIMLAALISCGLGIGSFAWAMDNLTPVLVKFREHSILALISKSVTPPGNDLVFALLEEEEILWDFERFGLIGLKESTFYSIGLFPLQPRLGREHDNIDTKGEYACVAAEPRHKWFTRLEADVNVEANNGWTGLQWAVQNGHEVVMRRLLEKSPRAVIAKDKKGWTVLHEAARNGHEAMVQLLLKKGADVDAKDDDGLTSLHLAAWNGHQAIMHILLENKADVSAEVTNGDHTLTALHMVAQNGHEAAARVLLEKGADINTENNYRWTALHLATYSGHEAIVRMLLEAGADVKSSLWGMTLHVAAFYGHFAVVRQLLENWVDVNVKGVGGLTALHAAASKGHDAVVQLLLDKGGGTSTRRITADERHCTGRRMRG
jgi:ankyrin repeat protein